MIKEDMGYQSNWKSLRNYNNFSFKFELILMHLVDHRANIKISVIHLPSWSMMVSEKLHSQDSKKHMKD